MADLLPPNATELERALAETTARISDLPVDIRDLWSAERCPIAFLPLLAWQMSVDEWLAEWPEEIKREVIAAALDVHRKKGTIGSIRRVLIAAGYPDATVMEHLHRWRYDGQSAQYNGRNSYGDPDHWPLYRIVLEGPVSASDLDIITRVLENTAPARCHLVAIHAPSGWRYNGTVQYDSTHLYGE
ncbi:MAG: phage tail protein I [Gammaproteobacteria bacterium]|nr:phage tail protein I [Gammaproteobacteria bacterium]